MSNSRFESRKCNLREKDVSIQFIPIHTSGNPEPVDDAFDKCLDKEIPLCCDLGCKYASLNSGVDPFEEPLD